MPAKRMSRQAAASSAPRSPWGKLIFIGIVIAGFAASAFYPSIGERINLGLDLRGGTYMVLKVHLDEAVRSSGERVASAVRTALGEKGITPTHLAQEEPGRIVASGIAEGSHEVADEVFATVAQPYDVTWTGDEATLQLRSAAFQDLRAGAARQVKETIDRRINEFGVAEPQSRQAGEDGDRIVLQLPGLDDAERVKRIITKASVMEFRLGRQTGATREELEQSFGGTVPDDVEILAGNGEPGLPAWYVLSREVAAHGDDLIDARPSTDEFGRPVVAFELGSAAGDRFGEFTQRNVGQPLAIVIDGRVVTYATIQSQIFARGQLTGRYTMAQAADQALTLRSGALPARVTIQEERTVGPSLGRDSIAAGTRAALAGFLAVMVFLLLWYKGAGINAVIALTLNIVIVLGLLALIGATLTLPGIAGLILTMVSAVDANVIIFERIKEELLANKGPAAAVEAGFSKAFSAIFDSNVTTLLAAFFLYNFGTDHIRGFAVTLSLGILASFFTAIVVSRALFEALIWLRPNMRTLSIQWRAPRVPSIRFMKWAPLAVGISALAVALSLAIWFGRGLNYGIDFRGGVQVVVDAGEGTTADDLRARLAGTEFADAVIQRFGGDDSPGHYLLRILGDEAAAAAESEAPVNVGEDGDMEANASSRLVALLSSGEGGSIRVISSESVGPAIGSELREKAFWAIASSISAILLYVAIRFRFNFGLGAVVALAHDVIVAVGVLTLLGVEFDINVIAALLTLAGYSLNDTIVIFDRVRENRTDEQTGSSLSQTLDDSVNQSLSRTFLTASTSLLATVSILLFGGPVLHGFALALTIGMIAGTYSTVFVASPVVLAWERLRQRRTARETTAA